VAAVDTIRGAHNAPGSQGIARGKRRDGRGDGSAQERAIFLIGGTGSKQKSGCYGPAHSRTQDCQSLAQVDGQRRRAELCTVSL